MSNSAYSQKDLRILQQLHIGQDCRGVAETMLRNALVFLEAIPPTAMTRADKVMAACIRYYLK